MNQQIEQDKGLDQQKESIVPPPPKSKLPLFLTFGLLVVLILVGGYKLMSNSTTPPPQPIPTQSPTTSTTDTTANWKTYTDEEWFFTLRYPNDWYFFAKNTAEIGNTIAIANFDIESFQQKDYKNTLRVNISREETTLSLQDYIDSKHVGKVLSSKLVTVNGIDGIQREEEGLGRSIITYLPNNGYIYIVAMSSESVYLQVGYQILSTFKFLK